MLFRSGKRQAASFQDDRSRIYDRYRSYLAKPERDQGDFVAIRESIREYNKRIKDAGVQKETPEIKFSEMRTRISKEMRRAGKRERAMLQ